MELIVDFDPKRLSIDKLVYANGQALRTLYMPGFFVGGLIGTRSVAPNGFLFKHDKDTGKLRGFEIQDIAPSSLPKDGEFDLRTKIEVEPFNGVAPDKALLWFRDGQRAEFAELEDKCSMRFLMKFPELGFISYDSDGYPTGFIGESKFDLFVEKGKNVIVDSQPTKGSIDERLAKCIESCEQQEPIGSLTSEKIKQAMRDFKKPTLLGKVDELTAIIAGKDAVVAEMKRAREIDAADAQQYANHWKEKYDNLWAGIINSLSKF